MIPNFQMEKLRYRKVICPKKHIIIVQWAFLEESCLFIILSPECRKCMSLEGTQHIFIKLAILACPCLLTLPTSATLFHNTHIIHVLGIYSVFSILQVFHKQYQS